jgi:hypothetical protein
MTGAMARTKGQAGEREAANLLAQLTGRDVRRRVRNHAGDSDLEGLPGWSLEIKRHATARPGEIAAWWSQTVAQALRGGGKPLLMYRADHASWRCVWPATTHLPGQPVQLEMHSTLTATPETWWLMCQHL